jgi:hypothetical protein
VKNNRKPLSKLFESARQEQSAVPSERTRKIVEATVLTSNKGKHLMISLAALCALAIATTYIVTSPAANVEEPQPLLQVTEKPVYAVERLEQKRGDGKTVLRTKQMVVTTDSTVQISVVELSDNELNQLLINAESLQEILLHMPNADSIRECGGKVCVWNDGNRNEIPLIEHNGMLPFMITSNDGKGRVIHVEQWQEVDPNELVPLATSDDNGGTVLWYQPTRLTKLLHVSINSETTVDVRDSNSSIQIHTTANPETAVIRKQIKRTIDSALLSVEQQLVSLGDKVSISDALDALYETRSFDIDPTDIDPTKVTANIRAQVLVLDANSDGAQPLLRKIYDAHNERSTPATKEGALKIVGAFPNPVRDASFTVQLTLAEPRTLTLELFTINGNKVATLANNLRPVANSGQVSIPCSIPNVPAGMYIVTATTDKAEKVMYRVVVD